MATNLFLVQALSPLWGGGEECWVMKHCWYLTAQILFVIIFAVARRHFVGELTWLRLTSPAQIIGAAILANCCEVMAWTYWKPTILFPLWHLPTFVVGAMVGQAILHIKLSPFTSQLLGKVCDALVLVICLLCGSGYTARAANLFFSDCYSLLAVVMFGLCRTRCWTSRLLSLPFISRMGVYSFAFYVWHYPIIMWANFVLTHRETAGTWGALFQFDYTSLSCEWDRDLRRDVPFTMVKKLVPPFTIVALFGVVMCVAVAFTHMVHMPCQRFINGWLSRVGQQTQQKGDEQEMEHPAWSAYLALPCSQQYVPLVSEDQGKPL